MSLNLNGNKLPGSYSSNSEMPIYGGTVILLGFVGNRTDKVLTNFRIGTTPDGNDVFSKPTIGAREVVVLSSLNLNKQFFSFTNDQILYISADNWNGATIGMTIFFDFIN